MFCARPGGSARIGMPLAFNQQVRADDSSLTSMYCAWNCQSSFNISTVYFCLGSVGYIMDNYAGNVSSSSNYEGLYNTVSGSAPYQAMTFVFTTTGLTFYQSSANSQAIIPTTGSAI